MFGCAQQRPVQQQPVQQQQSVRQPVRHQSVFDLFVGLGD
ncbi:hypothetical protein LA76x_3650 [Lysobacter antibioticus]|uniref:Uncharacterized protein n=1 Tax=Lysobacter antibioticus TaxID=84531 RepID=A0A0S2FDZ6_LYSAN|nr:hypothetical protein LA76x_3650 [Lysobacter antibioticus]